MKSSKDPRHEGRKIALQVLFEWSFNSIDVDKIMERNLDSLLEINNMTDQENKPDIDLANFLVKGVTENLDTIDKIIEESAPEWPVNQIAKIDLEVLRLAILELYIARNVPPKVSIDEAVELAKEFGGENSSKFVNGVLGTVVKKLMPDVISSKNQKNKQNKKKE
ncbi:transcription antitermination factor NusB [Patescibacteria group bacterium]|nr:transcription antitermination factor NusB [Patescibacteria group bacterium]